MKNMPIRRFIFACLCISLSSTACAEDLVTVAWRIKPPHQYTVNGQPQGILVERAKQVFSQAQIQTKFVEETTKRVLNNFKIGEKNYCTFGMYRGAGRESIAQFSSVFHIDPPQIIVASPAALKLVSAHATLLSLLADANLTLGVGDSSSYGAELDSMIKASKNKIERTTTLQMNMARMVAANRASFMFMDRDDWEYLKNSDAYVRGASQVDLPGMPPGQKRYILCSKDMKPEQMQRINAAIQKVNATKSR
jgi:polar amino acid transport system substrate-binding protein